MVFIMYHQVNELIFKMILGKLTKFRTLLNSRRTFFTERLMRISRYFDMLTTSFSIMENGMEVEQYMKFRNTLTQPVVSECTVPTY
jgi:tryptophan 2,3-dioxygenase